MKLEKMPTAELEALRAEVEAMIQAKIAERRQHLETELAKLAGTLRRANGAQRESNQGKCLCQISKSRQRHRDLVRTRTPATVAGLSAESRQGTGILSRRVASLARGRVPHSHSGTPQGDKKLVKRSNVSLNPRVALEAIASSRASFEESRSCMTTTVCRALSSKVTVVTAPPSPSSSFVQTMRE